MTLDLWPIVPWLFQTITTSGVALLGFIGLRTTAIGERFVGHHLDQKITELRHTYDQKIEELRAELAHLGDRRKRANEQEFEAVGAIWNAFVDAFLRTSEAVVSFLSFPDLDSLNPDELTAFLDATELSAQQRGQVAAAADKNTMYGKVMNLRRINAAAGSIWSCRLLLRTKGIFVQKNLLDEFSRALETLSSAQIEQHIKFQDRNSMRTTTHGMALLRDGELTFDRLQSMVRERLVRD